MTPRRAGSSAPITTRATREPASALWSCTCRWSRRSPARHGRRGAEHDDLVQAGSIGLLNAIERFDPKRGEEFVAFAVPTVEGEMKRHIRDRTGPVRLPRRLQEASVRLPSARDELTARLNRAPTSASSLVKVGPVHPRIWPGLESSTPARPTKLRRRKSERASWTRASRACCSRGPFRASTTPTAESSTCASCASSAGGRSRTRSASHRARSRAARTPPWPRCGPSSRAGPSSPRGLVLRRQARSPGRAEREPRGRADRRRVQGTRRAQRPADAAHAPVAAHGARPGRRARRGEPEPVHHQHAGRLDALALGRATRRLQRRRAGCPPRS